MKIHRALCPERKFACLVIDRSRHRPPDVPGHHLSAQEVNIADLTELSPSPESEFRDNSQAVHSTQHCFRYAKLTSSQHFTTGCQCDLIQADVNTQRKYLNKKQSRAAAHPTPRLNREDAKAAHI